MPEQQSTPFDAFWSDVPHKIGKEQARKAWKRLSPPDRQEAQKHVKAFYAWFFKTFPTASPLHPSTYLNNKRWQDEALRPALRSSEPVDRAAYWAKQINAGKPVARSYASSGVWIEIIDRGLVDHGTMRERGLT
jgi:hypothetical protein